MRSTRLEIRVGISCIDDENIYIGQNLEVEGARFEIQVGADCNSIENICVSQNLEMEDTELEIQVKASLLAKNIKVCCIYECYRG